MNPDQYRAFIREVLPRYGYQWRRFDRRNTRRKIGRRMDLLGLHEAPQYASLVETDPVERDVLLSLLPVTITRFYRNARVWNDLERLLAESCTRASRGGPSMRVWSAGCAGGEEAFTAAMMLDAATGTRAPGRSWKVLGTDIDRPSLSRSEEARYGWGSVREVPVQIRDRWFIEEGGAWRLREEIRAMVQIRRHDLVEEDPPGRFHVVLMRNAILTYNTADVQRKVLQKIHGCLDRPGLLVIGRTEILPEGAAFEEVDKCIYRRV